MKSQSEDEIVKRKKYFSKIKYKLIRKLPKRLLAFLIQRAIFYKVPIRPISGRIIIVCPTLQAGGAERQVVNTMNGLRHANVENVVLLCQNLDSTNNFYLNHAKESGWEVREVRDQWDGLKSVALPKRIKILKKYVNKSLSKDVINLFQEFHDLRPEIVHSWLDWSNVRAGIASLLAGVPKTILSGRNVSPRHFELNTYYFHSAYSVILNSGKDKVAFLNNSNAGARDYEKWLSLPKNRISVLRNGINFSNEDILPASVIAEQRKKYNIPANAKVIGGMFRFSYEKDPVLWLKVAKHLAKIDLNVYFILFGEGAMRSIMEKFISDNNLAERIYLAGKACPATRGLSVCDVVFLVSKKEGTPNVLLEAQSLGIPVVTTVAGGAAEAVFNGVTGFVVGSRNEEEIAEAVWRCATDKKINDDIRNQGPKFVFEKYGMQRMIDETLSVYGLD